MMADETEPSAPYAGYTEAEPQPPAPPSSRLGLRLAAGAAIVLFAGMVVLGSVALLDWWDKRTPDTTALDQEDDDTAAAEPKRPTKSPLGKIYAPKGAGFSAAFPKRPKRRALATPDVGSGSETAMYFTDTKNHAYIVGVTRLPRGNIDKVNLRKAAAAGAERMNGKLLRTKMTQHQGFEAVNWTAKTSGKQKAFYKGLAVLTPRRLYQVITVGRAMPDRQHDLLRDSFWVKDAR